MKYLGKMDRYVGVFLSSIVGRMETERMEFGYTRSARIFDFKTDLGSFRTYIKYSKRAIFSDRVRFNGDYISGMRCDFNFSEDEYKKLLNDFPLRDKQNYIILICFSEDDKQNRIMSIPYEDAISKALSYETTSGTRRISVVHENNKHKFYYYGVVGKPIYPNWSSCGIINHLKYFSEIK